MYNIRTVTFREGRTHERTNELHARLTPFQLIWNGVKMNVKMPLFSLQTCTKNNASICIFSLLRCQIAVMTNMRGNAFVMKQLKKVKFVKFYFKISGNDIDNFADV